MAKDPKPMSDSEESIESEEEVSSDENRGSGSESETDDDDRPLTPLPQKQPAGGVPQKQPSADSSSSDEDEAESGSESESDTPIKKPDPNVKPPAAKATEAAQKSRSKPSATGATSPVKGGVKRQGEKGTEAESKETKKAKKMPGSGAESSAKKPPSSAVGEDAKKQLFQRLWSEEDEIIILKGMMDYAAKKKADAVADLGAFLEFIKKSLHVEVTRAQLQDKIRRLKKKYENNASKVVKNGKERVFSKAHEQEAYDLSKKIWGTVNLSEVSDEKAVETPKVNGSVVRRPRTKNVGAITPKAEEVSNMETKDVELEDNQDEGLKSRVGGSAGSAGGSSVLVGLEEWIMNQGTKKVEGGKQTVLDEKWRKFKIQELELYLEKMELMCEQTKLVIAAMRAEG